MIGFAQNLYLWRISKGLSQQALAKAAGIPRPNLSAIESGKREPSLQTLRSLAISLAVTPGELVNGIPPVHFKDVIFTRSSLEAIVRASLGEMGNHLSAKEKAVSLILSGVIQNRINASNNTYKNMLKSRQTYINNWLALKAAIRPEILNNLLSRLDKHIYGSKADR